MTNKLLGLAVALALPTMVASFRCDGPWIGDGSVPSEFIAKNRRTCRTAVLAALASPTTTHGRAATLRPTAT